MMIYVAGSTKDVFRVKVVQRMARRLGHSITFDWTGAEGEVRGDGSWPDHPIRGSEISRREIAACCEADVTIRLCLPNSDSIGGWIEAGATLGAGGELWVVQPPRDSVFWQHPRVHMFDELLELQHELKGR